MVGGTLSLNASSLFNSGLWQGSHGFSAQADQIDVDVAGRTLSGGALSLNAGELTTLGTIQGQTAIVTANNWQNSGSLLGIDSLNVTIAQR